MHLEIFTIKVSGFAVCFLTSAADTNGKRFGSRVLGERTRMIRGDGAEHFLPSSFPPPLPSYELASSSYQAEGHIKNRLAGGSSGCLLGNGEIAWRSGQPHCRIMRGMPGCVSGWTLHNRQ